MIDQGSVIVKRSKRKTASIYIEKDGSVTVQVPEKCTDQQVAELLNQQEYKIYKFQAKRELLNAKAVVREPVNGESYLFLGRNYTLQFSNTVTEAELKDESMIVPDSKRNRLPQIMKVFYRKKGIEFLPAIVKKYSEYTGITVDEISVFELKTRWASCSTIKPKINFHWKVMMAPVSVIEYLVVHELCHFKYKRHNAEFWNEVDKYYPDYRKQVSWLKEFGASLEI